MEQVRDHSTCKCDRWIERLLEQGCLHDSCSLCYADSTRTKVVFNFDSAARSYGTTSPTCTACDNATQQLPADAANEKLFVVEEPFLLRTEIVALTLDGLPGCQCCIEDSTGAARRAAMYLCQECNVNLLCIECKETHDKLCGDKHRVVRLPDDGQDIKTSCRRTYIPPVLCRQHNSIVNRWCCSCDTAKCIECAVQCAERCHSLCSSNELELNKCEEQLCSSTLEIENACNNLRHIESALELEHRADMHEIKKRKEKILEALYTAFDVAYDTLEKSFRETRRRIADFRHNAESIVSCSRQLTRKLLPSHRILIKRAQRAVDLHLQAAQRLLSREEAVLTRLGSSLLGEDLEGVMKSWIGSPVGLSVSETNDVKQVNLFANNTTRLKPQFPGYDIAAMRCGHVLVAAGPSGLHELDSRGFLVASWLPTPLAFSIGNCSRIPADIENIVEEVVSVDCVEDDSAVVGLKNVGAVLLLRRKANGNGLEWSEQQRFVLGQAAPFAISTRNDLLAVALGSINGNSRELLPGEHLATFNIKTGIRQAYTVYDIKIDLVVVVAQNAVVASSHDRVNSIQASTGQFVIESRSSDLQSRLWRILSDQPFFGITVSPSGALIYASVPREQGCRVVALYSDTGRSTAGALADVCHAGPNNIGYPPHSLVTYSQCQNWPYSDAFNSENVVDVCCTVRGTRFVTSDVTERRKSPSSNIAFGKLSCSKLPNSKLVALTLDSRVIHSRFPLKKPSLKDRLLLIINMAVFVFHVINSIVCTLFLWFPFMFSEFRVYSWITQMQIYFHNASCGRKMMLVLISSQICVIVVALACVKKPVGIKLIITDLVQLIYLCNVFVHTAIYDSIFHEHSAWP